MSGRLKAGRRASPSFYLSIVVLSVYLLSISDLEIKAGRGNEAKRCRDMKTRVERGQRDGIDDNRALSPCREERGEKERNEGKVGLGLRDCRGCFEGNACLLVIGI